MEFFKPPDFSDSTADGSSPAVPLQSFSDSDDSSLEPEKFVANILEDRTKSKKRKIDYSQFNSAEFNEVDTLLTNVEDYSRRIREDVDKYARQVRNETDLIRSEIELELANALVKRMEAEKKAKEILQDAEDNRETVLKQGHDEGFQAGFAEGIQQHKAENEKNTGAVLALLEELKNLRRHMMQQNEDQIVRLCQLMAQKVVYRELKVDKNLVLGMLKKAIQHFEGLGHVKIKVHPVECDFILEHQPDLKKFLGENQVVTIRADETIDPASPVIESDFTVVDLNLNRQFNEIEQRIRNCVEDRKALFA